MYLTLRLTLKPNKEQERLLRQFSGGARFCYNEALSYWNNWYENYNGSPSLQDLLSHLQDLKYNYDEYKWLQNIPITIQNQSCRDLINAFKKYFKGVSRRPKFKKKNRCRDSFYQRIDKFRVVNNTHVKITGIKQPVKIGKNNRDALLVLQDCKFYNPRVVFDGKHWFINLSVEVNCCDSHGDQSTGVDMGVRKLATLSDGTMYQGLHKDTRIIKLESRLKRLQRIVSRKYEANKQGNRYIKTNNIKKLERKIRLIHKCIRDIRTTYLHTISMEIVSKSKAICIEDLNISGMMKNKHLSRLIQLQGLYTLRQFITYKAEFYGADLYIADRYYPSSKLCSCCGNKKNYLGADETYICSNCGAVIDRDLNAAKNLQALIPA